MSPVKQSAHPPCPELVASIREKVLWAIAKCESLRGLQRNQLESLDDASLVNAVNQLADLTIVMTAVSYPTLKGGACIGG